MRKIDRKDRKILSILDLNARAPLSAIAKNARLSKELVHYRMQALERKGIIRGYYALVDVTRLGYLFYRLLLKTTFDSAQESEFITRLKSMPGVAWIGSLSGDFDMVVIIWAKNPIEFKQLQDRIVYINGVQESAVSIATKIHHFTHNYLFETKDQSNRILGQSFALYSIDDIDKKILHSLTHNCRVTLLELAQQLNVAPNTIKNRIKKLEREGIIFGYRVMIDMQEFNYEHYKVLLNFHNSTEQDVRALQETIKQNSHVIYITEAIGLADLEFEMMHTHFRGVHDFIKKLKAEFPNKIRETRTLPTIREHYINYFPL